MSVAAWQDTPVSRYAGTPARAMPQCRSYRSYRSCRQPRRRMRPVCGDRRAAACRPRGTATPAAAQVSYVQLPKYAPRVPVWQLDVWQTAAAARKPTSSCQSTRHALQFGSWTYGVTAPAHHTGAPHARRTCRRFPVLTHAPIASPRRQMHLCVTLARPCTGATDSGPPASSCSRPPPPTPSRMWKPHGIPGHNRKPGAGPQSRPCRKPRRGAFCSAPHTTFCPRRVS
jgi:hypothetical protein